MTLLERFNSEKGWRNRCLLLELIHLSAREEDNKWKIRDTAHLVNLSMGTTSENLQLAKLIHSNDLIASCKSRNSAIKLMRKSR